MTDGSQTGAEPPAPRPARPRLDTFSLIGSAFWQVRAQWPPAVALWLASVALSWATWAAGLALGVASRAPGILPSTNPVGYVAVETASALTQAILGALALRLFLAPQMRGAQTGDAQAPWWRPDRNLAAATAILTLASLAGILVSASRLGSMTTIGPGGIAARSGMLLATVIVQVLVYSYLSLWPAGAAVGDRAMTPIRSVQLMRGHVASYIGAIILLQLPSWIWGMGASMVRMGHVVRGQPPSWPLGIALISAAVTVLYRAIAARLYGALALSASPPGAVAD